MWPENAEILQSVVKTSFNEALDIAKEGLSYPNLTKPITQDQLTTEYMAFGGIPEPRQMGYTQASSGQRIAKELRDFKLTGSVVPFETTVEIDRAVIETNPSEVPRITSEMAEKCILHMERRFVGTVLPSTTMLGYDGIALYTATHAETGANQDNDLTSAAATGTKPTGAEIESDLDTELASLKAFTDDTGSPVNAGVTKYAILVPAGWEYLYRSVLEPVQGQAMNVDASGGTGRYRGMFKVYGSPFVATEDRHYLFAIRGSGAAVALATNKDWEIKTNIGTDADSWNLHNKAVFTAYGRFEFYIWDWKRTLRQVWT